MNNIFMTELANKIIDILSTEGVNTTLALTKDSESKHIPYIHSFPKNCCEVVSCLFAMIAKDVSPESSIEIVKGTTDSGEHFWVTIDELVFDLTAHQFTNTDHPKLGVITNDIPRLRISHSKDVITKFKEWDLEHKNDWLDFLKAKLSETSKLR